jgi:hypothetical protein
MNLKTRSAIENAEGIFGGGNILYWSMNYTKTTS